VFLGTATEVLEIVLGGAVATNQLTWAIDYVDTVTSTASASGPYSAKGVTNSSTAVAMLASPASGTTRLALTVSVVNLDTAPATVTVRSHDGSAITPWFQGTLQAGEVLTYEKGDGWEAWTTNTSKKTGLTGATGATGLQGLPGVALLLEGDEGPEGLAIPGPVGPTGATGGTGSQGVQGTQGLPGVTFLLDGEQGEDGQAVPGPVGPTGATGSTGSTGAQGIQGLPGVALLLEGDEGPEGMPVPGSPGAQGVQGIQGITGAQGPLGVTFLLDADQGDDGMPVPGNPGSTGATGAQGIQGLTGPPAALGADDPPDENAYLLACGAGPGSSLPTLTNGQLLIGSTGNPPVAAALGTGTGLGTTLGPGTLALNLQIDSLMPGRLSSVNNFAISTADQTAVQTIYFVAYGGSIVSLCDSTSIFLANFAGAATGLPLQQALSGTTTNTLKTVTGLSSTTQLVRGMQVTGTNVAAASTIASIDSASQVTLNNACTGSATNTITFKLPPSTVYDVWLTSSAGSPLLQFGNPWTNSTTRADGVGIGTTSNAWWYCNNSAAINATDYNVILKYCGRYLGTIATTGTAGQTEDSALNRLVWSYYNRRLRPMSVAETTATWTYAVNTWRSANASTANRVNFVVGFAEDPVTLQVFSAISSGQSTFGGIVGVGLDRTNGNDAQVYAAGGYGGVSGARYNGFPAAGLHFAQWVEKCPGGSITFWGTHATGEMASGMSGEIWG
jgi:hypothetical protein